MNGTVVKRFDKKTEEIKYRILWDKNVDIYPSGDSKLFPWQDTLREIKFKWSMNCSSQSISKKILKNEREHFNEDFEE